MQPFSENTVNVPAFLSKLWKMVNDPSTDHLICWSPAGNSFIIQNQAQFWYELLPLYYKHNNMSSFVRQLNMYGFHKISTFENGTMDNDKGEIQFFHQYFQKDLPELLKNIKRKVTTTKSENVPQNIVKTDELAKVLSDVKYLRNRQANVDSQLSAMKQENAVLWRELAMLRQKHLKQQQIVNKLIQFLVTLVQPNTRMNGLSVKRRFPLMLNESPNNKRQKTKNKDKRIGDGPVIHELDNAEIIPDELLIDDPSQIQREVDSSEDANKVQSPETPNTASTTSAKDANSPAPSSVLLEEADPIDSELFWDNPELVYIDKENENQNPLITEDFLNTAANLSSGDALTVTQQDNTNVAAVSAATSSDNQKVFLNPSTQDTLLSNLINGNYNTNAINGKGTNSNKTLPKENTNKNSLVAVSSRDPNLGYTKLNSATTPGTNDCFSEDLDVHVESTQSELEQLKELLNSASFVDANALLGLFADDTPDYVITYNGNKEQPENADDTLISGSELATYDNCQIDFSELFDTSDVNETAPQMPSDMNTFEESVNTPQEVKSAPLFPTGVKINKK